MSTLIKKIGLLALVFYLLPALAHQDWRPVNSRFKWKFPEDHWAKREYRTEWWYLTGHLASAGREPRSFGYQFTFFRIGVAPKPLLLDSDWASGHMIMGHAAISELDKDRHWFSEVLYRENPYLGIFSVFPEPEIAWSLAPPGTRGRWYLRWNGKAFDCGALDQNQEFAFQLTSHPLKPLVFQGPGGVSPKSEDPILASLYYSFTRLQTSGTIETAGRTYQVTGESWMDREFSSNVLSEDQVGWDWFSLQLNDGTELMLFQLRDRMGRANFSWATLVSVDGEPTYLKAGDWRLVQSDRWESPSGAVYPSRWTLSLPPPSSDLEIVPAFLDQENRSRLLPGLNYWEGAIEVIDTTGKPLGRGYAELTGYHESGQLPL
jgi:predicted secreted hydrolase